MISEAALFDLFNTAICVPWFLLIVFPTSKITRYVIHTLWLPLALGVDWLAIKYLKPEVPPEAGILSLDQLRLLINSPYSLVGLWLQILLWDLFIGAWIARDAKRLHIAHGWIVPILLATFIGGPLGFVPYLLLRLIVKRAVSLDESTPTLNMPHKLT